MQVGINTHKWSQSSCL